MKAKKQYNLFNKIRAALRDVYRYSPMRKEAIKKASFKNELSGSIYFNCPVCLKGWPIQMADVDHEPPLGALNYLNPPFNSTHDCLSEWANRLFYGNVQVICKLCHKKKTASQRKKVAK